ncbi:MAG: bifunctional sugar-1-phosphate nucleotidylyltransferase/acetyltransferase [Thermoprotei archaeon]
MKAVILAAGKGERLQPITETRPKPLIPILCKPLLQWHLEVLEKIDSIEEIVIVIGYLKERIIEFLKSLKLNKPLRIVDQSIEKGTGDAVIKGIEKLDYNDEVLIVYSDIFLKNWSIFEKLAKINDYVLVAARVSNPHEYGVIVSEGEIFKGVIEKPKKPPSNLVNAGIYKLSVKDILENSDIKPSPRGELEFTDILNKISTNRKIRVLTINENEWIDIGLPWNILEANKMALASIKHQVHGVIEENVVIKPPVYIGENTLIRSGTYIEGPVYIDSDADIGPNARIRPNTVICRKARIGFSVETKESIIMEGAHIAHLSYVGDSIICEGVNFGAGTITANLRFDDKPVKVTIKGRRISSNRRKLGAIVGAYVKTGVNVSIMPGVKIGAYSWIAPGAVVYHDIPSKVFYRVKKTEYILENINEHND